MKVIDAYADARAAGRPLIACDFSPPRSADLSFADDAATLKADFICVAYNPGRAVRLGSSTAAAIIQRQTGTQTIFNLATRDMNKLAVQTHLLSARALGLENVLVLRGDAFPERDLRLVKPVDDYSPTDLLAAIKQMNAGIDFRGARLHAPTSLSAGAAMDLGRPLAEEAALAARKVEAGADFLMTQALFSGATVTEFRSLYQQAAGHPLDVPVLYGVAIMVKDGVLFADMPERYRTDLASGRLGTDIALEVVQELRQAGCDAFYLVPPIMRGGARDYAAAQAVIAATRKA